MCLEYRAPYAAKSQAENCREDYSVYLHQSPSMTVQAAVQIMIMFRSYSVDLGDLQRYRSYTAHLDKTISKVTYFKPTADSLI